MQNTFFPSIQPRQIIYLMYIILIKFRACDNMISSIVLYPKLMLSRHLRSGHLICLFCPTQCGNLLLLTFSFPGIFFFHFLGVRSIDFWFIIFCRECLNPTSKASLFIQVIQLIYVC